MHRCLNFIYLFFNSLNSYVDNVISLILMMVTFLSSTGDELFAAVRVMYIIQKNYKKRIV